MKAVVNVTLESELPEELLERVQKEAAMLDMSVEQLFEVAIKNILKGDMEISPETIKGVKFGITE